MKGPEIIRKNNFIINSGDNITQDQRNFRIKLNNEKYGLSKEFINSLKIPKLLSLSMGHHLNIKQIMDDKNNFSILEKIDQLKNLIECMKKKLQFIERVENKRKKEKSK